MGKQRRFLCFLTYAVAEEISIVQTSATQIAVAVNVNKNVVLTDNVIAVANTHKIVAGNKNAEMTGMTEAI